MFTRRHGFTIVELLIIIVVISILAAVSVTSYASVQKRASNSSKMTELRAWKKSFDLYKADYGTYPVMANAGYCLGTGFPAGSDGLARCRDYMNNQSLYSYTEADSVLLINELKKTSPNPTSEKVPVQPVSPHVFATVGPYVEYYAGNIRITGVFQGSSSADCPAGTTYNWTDGQRLLCDFYFVK